VMPISFGPVISKTARDKRLDYNGATIGNGMCGIKWSCDR